MTATHPDTGYRLNVYTHEDDWDKLAEPWRDLETRDSRAQVFQTFTWVSHLWRLDRGPKSELRLVAVHQPDGRLAALTPMMTQRLMGPIGVRALRFIGQGLSDYQDILLADDCDQNPALTLLGRWFDAARADCDIVDLSNLPEGAHLLEHRGLLFPAAPRWSLDCQEADVVRRIPESGGFAAFEASLGKRTRKNLRNQRRRVSELEGARIEAITRSRDADPAIADLMTLHQARQNSRGQRGLFRNRARVTVFTDLFKKMLDEGTLRLLALHAFGSRQAVQALLSFKANATAYNNAWKESPETKPYSIGKLILYMSIELALEDPAITEVDLGVGDEDYKASFTRLTRPIYRLTCRRSGLRCRLYDLHERSLDFAYHSPWVQRLYFALRSRSTRPTQ